MNSFQTELNTKFPQTFEAGHVISNDQVWVGVIPNGPKGKPLLGTFKNVEEWSFQDEVGEALESMIQHIPGGVLVFLTSYKYSTLNTIFSFSISYFFPSPIMNR